MKIRYILIGALVIIGAAIGFFVPFTTIVKTAKSVSAPILKMLTPQEKKSLLESAHPQLAPRLMAPAPREGVEVPSAETPAVPVPTAPSTGESTALAVSGSGLDSILNFLQRILGFASTLVGLFLGVKTLKGEQKKKRAAAKAAGHDTENKPKRPNPLRVTSRPGR